MENKQEKKKERKEQVNEYNQSNITDIYIYVYIHVVNFVHQCNFLVKTTFWRKGQINEAIFLRSTFNLNNDISAPQSDRYC